MAEKTPRWKIVLSVLIPDGPKKGRPRRMSMHTLAYLCGCKTRREVLALMKEIKESGEVVGYVCPDVHTPIFYLKANAKLPTMIDTRDEKVWTVLEKWLDDYPYPEVKGFKRFPANAYDPKTGKIDYSVYGMKEPFEESDKAYAANIEKALVEAGYSL